ncbi:MAG: peptidyl-prolyl cis-trans isomerase [Lachnospiraceae bacterium]|nr:peptidyl-prolyl cis-trans isomerase [Lachnospiraceae bacterium]
MKKKWTAVLLLLALTASLLAGCKQEENDQEKLPTSEGFTSDVVMRIGGKDVSYAEANIYLMSMREEVETLYGTDIWDFVFTSEGETYSTLMKKELLQKIIYIKLVCFMADEFNVALDADDILNVNDYTQEYMSGVTEEAVKQYGITEELIRSIYMDNVLAEKIYETITLNAEKNYDDDDVLRANFQYIRLSKYYEDLEGNQVAITGDELTAVREKADRLLAEAQTAEDFYGFAKENTDDSTVEMTVGKSDLPVNSSAAAFALKDGELSGVVEEEDGFYIFYCKSARDELATQVAEEALIAELSQEYFDSLYQKWIENVTIEINQALWDAM